MLGSWTGTQELQARSSQLHTSPVLPPGTGSGKKDPAAVSAQLSLLPVRVDPWWLRSIPSPLQKTF